MSILNQEKSRILFERAQQSLVGGVNSPVRAFKRVGGSPVIAKRGLGAQIWDVDDNVYIDFLMSFGPHLFGHAYPPIQKAVAQTLGNSSCFGVTSELEILWAEKLKSFFPHFDKVRAVSTGTEACATAIRLARGITRRDLIVKCAGHYHGHVDALMVDAGSGIATLSTEAVADSAGIPSELAKLSRVVEFNNVDQVKELFVKEGSRIAAIILEPVMGNMGVVPPTVEYLQTLRDLCDASGALLIFDEVMTGLRVHKFSAQGLYGVQPDLTTLGKIVGGGLPLAALIGPSRHMNQLAPMGPVYQGGTLSGNPLGMAAGLAMLTEIQNAEPYEALESTSRQIEELFQTMAAEQGVVVRTERVGSMLSVYFRKDPVRNAKDCREINEEQFKVFFWTLMEEGIMIPPSPFEAFFISTEHANVDKKEFAMKLQRVFAKVKSTVVSGR